MMLRRALHDGAYSLLGIALRDAVHLFFGMTLRGALHYYGGCFARRFVGFEVRLQLFSWAHADSYCIRMLSFLGASCVMVLMHCSG